MGYKCFLKKLYNFVMEDGCCDSTNKDDNEPTKTEPSLMLKRIQTLYKKLNLIADTRVENLLIDAGYTYEIYPRIAFYVVQIPTTNGNRIITVSKNRLTYGLPKEMDLRLYKHEPYDFSKILFSIDYKKDLKLTPYPLFGWTEESIDLAILEFEQAIEPYYMEATKRYNNFNKIFNYCSKDKP